jgi:hypothetical protein
MTKSNTPTLPSVISLPRGAPYAKSGPTQTKLCGSGKYLERLQGLNFSCMGRYKKTSERMHCERLDWMLRVAFNCIIIRRLRTVGLATSVPPTLVHPDELLAARN